MDDDLSNYASHISEGDAFTYTSTPLVAAQKKVSKEVE